MAQKTYIDIIGINLLGEIKLFGVLKEIEHVLFELGKENMTLQYFDTKINMLKSDGYIENFNPKIINTVSGENTPYFQE